MLPLLALVSANIGAIDCTAFAARSSQPIETRIERLSATSLAPDAKPIKPDKSWELTTYQIGKLVYQGEGYSFDSSDNRFPQIADSILNADGNICRYEVILPSGYDSAKGKFIDRAEITFYHPDQLPENSPKFITAEHGSAHPVLDGYVELSSSAIFTAGRKMLVALMRPTDHRGSQTTAIVIFSAKSRPLPATIIASVQGNYSSLSIVPNLHGRGCGLNLMGRGSDGSLKEVSLWMDGQTVDELAARFADSLE